MSHHYNAALEAELQHRRTALRHDAEHHRLARLAGRASRAAAARIARPARSARAAAVEPGAAVGERGRVPA